MSGFFEQYAEGSQWREKAVKWFFLAILAIALGYGVDWTLGRLGKDNLSDIRPQWKARTFYGLLEEKNYAEAYRLWGCTEAAPCKTYAMEKFMEDWGPKSAYANHEGRQKLVTRHCETGIVRTDQFKGGDMVHLYVDKRDLTLSFAPWGDSCSAPRMKVP